MNIFVFHVDFGCFFRCFKQKLRCLLERDLNISKYFALRPGWGSVPNNRALARKGTARGRARGSTGLARG